MTDNEIGTEILKIFLLTYSIICLVLLVVVYILIFRRKNFSDMEIFSLQLSLAPLLNAISYLLPNQNDTLCNIQAVTHVFSLFYVFSLYFIYYLNNYLLFSNSSLLNSKKTKTIMYILNWLFILILALINYYKNPVNKVFEFLCRYTTDNPIVIINIIYSVLMLLLGIILLYLIAKKIKKTVKASMNFEKNLYKNVVNIFIMIVIIFTLNVLGFFLKKIGGGTLIYEFIDRALECIGFLLVTVFLIGRKGFSELKQMFTRKKEQDYNAMNALNLINDDIQNEIDFQI